MHLVICLPFSKNMELPAQKFFLCHCIVVLVICVTQTLKKYIFIFALLQANFGLPNEQYTFITTTNEQPTY